MDESKRVQTIPNIRTETKDFRQRKHLLINVYMLFINILLLQSGIIDSRKTEELMGIDSIKTVG